MPKILIVDDEKMMLRIASKILSKDYDIICAGSGAEAMEIFLRERPDLVLTDLLMPEMDGYELQRRLQEQCAEPVPIIFMTADDSDDSESKSFALGAADYIHKPLKGDVLLSRVKNILDSRDKIQDLTEAANLDLMTGLLNKTAAQREIAALCTASRGVLMLLDLDSFKLVNDLHGHAAGDKILIHFAELIKASTDTAGRIGGDEFVAFCQNVRDAKIIFDKAQDLNRQLIVAAKKFLGADMNIPLGTSIGAVFVPDEGTDYATLLDKADKALYTVKHGGKHSCAFFGAEGTADTVDRKNISQTQMILAERNGGAGALFVDFDEFKAIYHFAARLNENSRGSIKFLSITLADAAATREDFLDTLIKILRRADCVTLYGRDQLLALLSVNSAAEVDIIRKKISAAWRMKNFGGNIIFEACDL